MIALSAGPLIRQNRRKQALMAAQHGPVGMVGTGNMGGRMTRRMVEAGHHVLAVDLDPARIPACGATPATGLAELRPGGLTIMHISHGRSGQPSEQRTATFTGTVQLDPVLTAPGVMINTVIF